MKKKMFKRAGVAVLSMSMLLSMGAMSAMTASAEGYTVTLPTDVVADKGETLRYDVYTIATATASGSSLNYTVQAPFTSVLSQKNGNITYGGNEYSTAATAAVQAEVASKLAACITSSTKPVKANQTGTVTDLNPGYYLIKAKGVKKTVQPIIVSVTNGNVTVREGKASDIPFNKTITEITNLNTDSDSLIGTNGKTGVADAGATVKFLIETQIPTYSDYVKTRVKANTDALDIEDYVITEDPEDTLTITGYTLKSVGNTTDTTTLEAAYTYAATTAETGRNAGFTLTFKDAFVVDHMGETVRLEVVATVANKDTVDLNSDSNNNHAKVKYSNDYSNGGKGIGDEFVQEKESDADVYCTLYTVNKKDNANRALNGATFAIYKGNKTTVLESGSTTTAKSGVTPIETIVGTSTNVFAFKGLANGTYTIVETSAPEGGYKLANAVEVVITSDKTAANEYDGTGFKFAIDGGAASTTASTDITNYKGNELPGTGGIGTTLFTVGGVAVVLLAGFMFIVYMRKRKIEE